MADENKTSIIILLDEKSDSNALAEALKKVVLPEASGNVQILVPPVRGIAFFIEEDLQDTLDAWWGKNVDSSAAMVNVFNHHNGLAECLKTADGMVYVGLPMPNLRKQYLELDNVKPLLAPNVMEMMAAIAKDYPEIFDTAGLSAMLGVSEDDDDDDVEDDVDEDDDDEDDVASTVAEMRRTGILKHFGFDDENEINFDDDDDEDDDDEDEDDDDEDDDEDEDEDGDFLDNLKNNKSIFDGSGPSSSPHRAPVSVTPVEAVTPPPMDMIMTGQQNLPTRAMPSPAPTPVRGRKAPNFSRASNDKLNPGYNVYEEVPARASGASGLMGKISIPKFPGFSAPKSKSMPSVELAKLIVARKPLMVAMGSRKGGVGKTSHAAAVAINGGLITSTVGLWTAIVDANLANPDAWGQLNLPAGVATVRSVITAIARNQTPPDAVYARTPGLVAYTEDRETTEYSQTEIDRFAEYVKHQHAMIVVDLSNRLPDINGGPEAAVTAYWLAHSDVLVLPTTHNRADFNGVLDYLDFPDLPPVIVAYIEPKDKAARNHPGVQEYLHEIASRDTVYQIVKIPHEEKAKLTGYGEGSIADLTTELKNAYQSLTEAIIRSPQRFGANDY